MKRRVWAGGTVLMLLTAIGVQAAIRFGPLGAPTLARAGARALSHGDALGALPLMERWATGAPGALAWYQVGIVRLELGDAVGAGEAFAQGLTHPASPEIERRLLHNLSRVRLDQALAAHPGEVIPPALAAVAAGRQALRLRPGASGTRRNLALADRLLSRPSRPRRNAGREGGVRIETGGSGAQAASLSAGEARTILDAIRSSESTSIGELMDTLLGDRPLLGLDRRGPPW